MLLCSLSLSFESLLPRSFGLSFNCLVEPGMSGIGGIQSSSASGGGSAFSIGETRCVFFCDFDFPFRGVSLASSMCLSEEGISVIYDCSELTTFC